MTKRPSANPVSSAARTLSLFIVSLLFAGCSSLMTYEPRAEGPSQSVRFTQGVGTLTDSRPDQELFVYPTFKSQGPDRPTFTLGYANNSASPVDFSTARVRAYFRGREVPIYTYEERIDEIRTDKRGKQIALAVLGGLAAAGAAHAAANRTYTSNYQGTFVGPGRNSSYYGASQMRVYDPASGILAGAAVGGATALGFRQLEFNANAQEQAAEAILQRNTVEPRQMVSGQVILKNCCDPYPAANDVIVFEVATDTNLTRFTFDRGAPGRRIAPAAVSSQALPSPAAPRASTELQVPRPVPVVSQPVPAPATPASTGSAVKPTLLGGQDGLNAERVARSNACGDSARATLVAKGPGFESYSVACSSGDVMAVRCEMGNCRVLR